MTSDEQLIDKLRAAMLTEVAAVDVPVGLLDAVKRPRAGRLRAPSIGGLVATLASACAVTIAVVALASLTHSSPRQPQVRGGLTHVSVAVRALEAHYAVLRRPQTAADRLPRWVLRDARSLAPIPALVRLVRTVDVGPGRLSHVRVYLVIYHGRTSLRVTTIEITDRLHVVQGLHGPTRGGVQSNIGIARSVVPDEVRYVRWSFAEVTLAGQVRTVLVSAAVRDNVAVARLPRGVRGLVRSVWFESGGSVLVFRATAAIWQARAEVLRQHDLVAASARHRIAPALLARFGLLREPAPPDVATRALGAGGRLLIENDRFGLNLSGARYVQTPALPLLGREGGTWVIPGSRGICLDTSSTSGCGALSNRRGSPADVGMVDEGSGPRSETILGLAPDGNRTVTVVLATGARRTARVRDNIYSITVSGRVVALIVRNAAGRLVRISL